MSPKIAMPKKISPEKSCELDREIEHDAELPVLVLGDEGAATA